MKKTLLTLVIFSFTNSLFSQQIEKLDYCNCIDKIENNSPIYDGKYERNCNEKITTVGSFKNDLPDGEWISYNYKGGLISKINYSEGKFNGLLELYFMNGKVKFSGSFINGKKNGIWKYYNEKGTVVIDGEYEMDKPINIWTVKDKKGKKIVTQYDYANSKYILNEVEEKLKGSTLLGGVFLSYDLFIENAEVPIDFWDTYADLKYLARYQIEENSSSTFILTEENGKSSNTTITFSSNVQTDPESKLHKIEHNKLSKKLLYYRILKALSVLPPWIYKGEKETTIYIPYQVNIR
ncbi:toxin-antitoxin system YwqK family antitoxin [Flavobacterium sp. WC2509]|uniref:toxin-antitoxin system YwqK family antitoxin n=1 Tax=Flavobacterium sp. WC2509 TaxID=3461406 RepID=UPI0040450856